MAWSDDDYSEFAEALDDACQEWLAKGGRIGDDATRDECACPLGAAMDHPDVRFPGRLVASMSLGISCTLAWDFARGFDGDAARGTNVDRRAYALGQQFRAKYVGGG